VLLQDCLEYQETSFESSSKGCHLSQKTSTVHEKPMLNGNAQSQHLTFRHRSVIFAQMRVGRVLNRSNMSMQNPHAPTGVPEPAELGVRAGACLNACPRLV